MPVPIAIVRNEGTVGSNVMAELPNGLVQLQAIFERRAIHFEILFGPSSAVRGAHYHATSSTSVVPIAEQDQQRRSPRRVHRRPVMNAA